MAEYIVDFNDLELSPEAIARIAKEFGVSESDVRDEDRKLKGMPGTKDEGDIDGC